MQNSIHVTPQGDSWQREMAIKSASELYIHNKEGQIRAKNSYGNDPIKTRG